MSKSQNILLRSLASDPAPTNHCFMLGIPTVAVSGRFDSACLLTACTPHAGHRIL